MFGIDNPASSKSSATTRSTKHDQDDSETVWRRSIDALIEPVNSMVEAIRSGIEHTTIQLELVHVQTSIHIKIKDCLISR